MSIIFYLYSEMNSAEFYRSIKQIVFFLLENVTCILVVVDMSYFSRFYIQMYIFVA